MWQMQEFIGNLCSYFFDFALRSLEFYKNIFQFYLNVLGENISLDIELALFGYSVPVLAFSHDQQMSICLVWWWLKGWWIGSPLYHLLFINGWLKWLLLLSLKYFFARTDAFKRCARKRPQIFPNFLVVESWALKIHGQFYSYFSTPFLMCLEFDEVKLNV